MNGPLCAKVSLLAPLLLDSGLTLCSLHQLLNEQNPIMPHKRRWKANHVNFLRSFRRWYIRRWQYLLESLVLRNEAIIIVEIRLPRFGPTRRHVVLRGSVSNLPLPKAQVFEYKELESAREDSDAA